jgi:hypothetical protein
MLLSCKSLVLTMHYCCFTCYFRYNCCFYHYSVAGIDCYVPLIKPVALTDPLFGIDLSELPSNAQVTHHHIVYYMHFAN